MPDPSPAAAPTDQQPLSEEDIAELTAAAQYARYYHQPFHLAPEQLQSLLAERTRNRARLAELEKSLRIIVCAYCGHETERSPDRDETIRRMTDHIVTCEKHPLRKAVAVSMDLVSLVGFLLDENPCLLSPEAVHRVREAGERYKDLLPAKTT